MFDVISDKIKIFMRNSIVFVFLAIYEIYYHTVLTYGKDVFTDFGLNRLSKSRKILGHFFLIYLNRVNGTLV